MPTSTTSAWPTGYASRRRRRSSSTRPIATSWWPASDRRTRPTTRSGSAAALRHGFAYRLLWYLARKGALSTPTRGRGRGVHRRPGPRYPRPSAGRPRSRAHARFGGPALRGPRRAVHGRRHRHARRGDRQNRDHGSLRPPFPATRPGPVARWRGSKGCRPSSSCPDMASHSVALPARPSPWHARRTAETTPHDVRVDSCDGAPTDRPPTPGPELQPQRPRRAPGQRPRRGVRGIRPRRAGPRLRHRHAVDARCCRRRGPRPGGLRARLPSAGRIRRRAHPVPAAPSLASADHDEPVP